MRILLEDQPLPSSTPQPEADIARKAQDWFVRRAMLLIEQNAQMALQAAKRGYVIETGEIVLEDVASTLLGNERVRKAYLGEE